MAIYCFTAYVGRAMCRRGVGGANLLWLPAGIGLAAVPPARCLHAAAIFLATLGLSLLLFLRPSAVRPLQAIAATVVSALGSTLQAWATAWLLNRLTRTLQVHDGIRPPCASFCCTAVGCTHRRQHRHSNPGQPKQDHRRGGHQPDLADLVGWRPQRHAGGRTHRAAHPALAAWSARMEPALATHHRPRLQLYPGHRLHRQAP